MDREYWVDLGYIEEFYGHVYLCNVCFEQMADVVGFEKKQNEIVIVQEPSVYATIFSRLFGDDTSPESILDFLDQLDVPPILQAFAESMESGKKSASKSNNEPGPDYFSNASSFDEPTF